MTPKTEILIVGAGLSGLSAAYHLGKNKKVRIIEKENRPGGLAVTDNVNDFRFDKTGHLLHLKNPEMKKWIIDENFKKHILLLHRISRIWSYGRYTRYPFQSNTYGLPKAVAKECIDEFLKIQAHPLTKEVRTFADFIYHHFGKGFAKHFLIPYNKKIWGVDPKEMNVLWCKKFVPLPKIEDVLKGAKKNGGEELGYNVDFYYPKLGIGDFSNKIAEITQKKHEIEYNISLEKVDFRTQTALLNSGEKIRYEYLISTAPLKELSQYLDKPPVSFKNKANLLRFRSLNYLNIALKKTAVFDFHWCYVPSPKVPFYRVGYYSNFSVSCAPKGQSSLYVELTDRPFNKRILSQVIDYLKQMKIIRNQSDILFIDPQRIDYAYVIYDQNYPLIVPAIHQFLNQHNIYSVGRYGAWNYSSMEDALLMGREIAQKLN
ncbi:MAG: FAD-dependent oxidoreductase [Candidatus Staskawiczbacteria bacterium]|nr:FAD-dependent oxidoreductase [Candidatus Staskawiczbacteria bacterium]